MLLSVRDLFVRYGEARALEDVSIDVDRGEVVAIIGANGAGKTTVLRAISGLAKPSSGEIWFDGRRIDGRSAHRVVKSGIAHVPAGRMVFAPMTVADNLRTGAHTRRDRKSIERDLCFVYEHFPVLKEKESQLAGQLSGGQQQMLAIARALMAGPRLLLMDEPTVGLSPLMCTEVGEIVKKINASGITVLLVEQNCRIAFKLARRAYILELGSVVAHDSTDNLAKDENVRKYYLGGGGG